MSNDFQKINYWGGTEVENDRLALLISFCSIYVFYLNWMVLRNNRFNILLYINKIWKHIEYTPLSLCFSD